MNERALKINGLILFFLLGLAADRLAWPADKQDSSGEIILCLSKVNLRHYDQPRMALECCNSLIKDYMIPQLHFPIRFRFFENDKQMVNAFAQKKVDISCGPVAKFLKMYESGLVYPLVWCKQKKDVDNGDRDILIVRKGSHVSNLQQLRGLRLGISDPMDRISVAYLFFSKQPHFRLNSYFGRVKLFDSSRDSINSLAMGTSDVVFDTQYFLDVFQALRPDLSQTFEVLPCKSDTLPELPIFCRSSIEPDKKEKIEKIKDFFMQMNEDPGQHQLLVLMGCDQLMPITPEQEKSYRSWMKKYRAMGLIQ